MTGKTSLRSGIFWQHGGEAKATAKMASFLDGILSSLGGALSMGGGSAVGLSVGSSSVKLVELKKSGKGWKLANFAMVPLPEEVLDNREIVQPRPVSDAIRHVQEQLKLSRKDVCAGLSGNFLIIKKMSLEVPNPKEIEEQVFWEAEQYLTFDPADVVMDYQVLSKGKDRNIDVILVAAKRSSVDSYMGVVTEGGFKPAIVDVDYFAMQNCFEANYPVNPGEAVALVDIGAVGLKVAIVHDGAPIFTKDSALGGRNLTLEIQKQLSHGFADAENLKVSGSVPQEVSDLMHVMCENYAGEIRRTLDFYSASTPGAPVSYILLSGGGARLPGLAAVIEAETGKPTQMMNPFAGIGYDESFFTQDRLNEIAPVAVVPVGLALRAGAR
jgi:type IV pilus assembly protein PilM